MVAAMIGEASRAAGGEVTHTLDVQTPATGRWRLHPMWLSLGLIVPLLACAPSPPDTVAHTLSILPGEVYPHASGVMELPTSHRPPTAVRVSLEGLAPQSSYVLSLNAAEPDSPTGEALGRLTSAGWPTGALYHAPEGGELGVWNFATLRTDSEGRAEQTLELPLPPGDYKARLFVKTSGPEGNVHILQSQIVFLAVDPVSRAWSWGLLGAAVVPLLGWGLWVALRKRSSRDEPGEDRSAGSERRNTLVDRCRADGTLRHSPTYHWVEICGRRKTFRPRQALVLQILCEHDPNGDGLPQQEIVRIWEKTFATKRADPLRVRDIFRAYPDEPGDFLVRLPGPASVYRLRLEPRGTSTEVAVPPPRDTTASQDLF